MSLIAILGAGAIGGALTHRLAARGRVREVRLIDTEGTIAQGKALDILQSSPIEGFTTRVSSANVVEAAAGADAIVIADAAKGDVEHADEPGLALMRKVTAMETAAPLVFAGASQRLLMARTVGELRVAAPRVVGSAAGALESALRAITALEVDSTGVEIHLRIVGVPPRDVVIAWEAATAFGQPISAVIPPHRLAAIDARVPGIWPPGPLALASAAARTAEAIAEGSRRRFTCFVSLDRPPARGSIVAMPVELGPRGVERVLPPALSRQEQTRFENGLER